MYVGISVLFAISYQLKTLDHCKHGSSSHCLQWTWTLSI